MNDRLRYLAVSIFVSAAWLPQPRAYAADCVWLGGIGNWTDSNWGTCLGGFPASGDTAAIGAGVVTLDQAVLIQQLSFSAGTITGNNDLGISGLTAITGGNSVMSGTGTTRADGGLTIDGNFLDIQSTRNLVNGAGQSADWSAGGLRLLNPGSTLTNEATATFNITGTSRNLQGSGTLDNQGSLVVALSGPAEAVTVTSGLVNDGNIAATNGSLILSTDASGTGNWQASGGRIQLNSAADVTTTGDVSVTGGGTLQLNNASSLTARDLTLDASATLEAIGNNTLALTGDLSFAMTGEAQWVFDLNASLEMNGGSGALLGDWGNWSRLEIGGNDIGTDPVNHVGAPLGFSDNFDLSELVIGADAHVILRDLFDNGNRGGTFGAAEALYVDTLVFGDANAVLNLNGLHIYYNTLIGSTNQIINEAVPLPASVWLLVSGLLGLAGLGRRAGTA